MEVAVRAEKSAVIAAGCGRMGDGRDGGGEPRNWRRQ